MSIQYMALGFEPTILRREFPPITTRPLLQSSSCLDGAVAKLIQPLLQ